MRSAFLSSPVRSPHRFYYLPLPPRPSSHLLSDLPTVSTTYLFLPVPPFISFSLFLRFSLFSSLPSSHHSPPLSCLLLLPLCLPPVSTSPSHPDSPSLLPHCLSLSLPSRPSLFPRTSLSWLQATRVSDLWTDVNWQWGHSL